MDEAENDREKSSCGFRTIPFDLFTVKMIETDSGCSMIEADVLTNDISLFSIFLTTDSLIANLSQ